MERDIRKVFIKEESNSGMYSEEDKGENVTIPRKPSTSTLIVKSESEVKMETDIIKEEFNSDMFSEEDIGENDILPRESSTSTLIVKSESEDCAESNVESVPFKLFDIKQEFSNTLLNVENIEHKKEREFRESTMNARCLDFEAANISEQIKVEYDVKTTEKSAISPIEEYGTGKYFDDCSITSSLSVTKENASGIEDVGTEGQVSGLVLRCSHCGLKFSSPQHYSYHEHMCLTNNGTSIALKYKYDVCDKKLHSKDGLHKHMALHTEKNSFLCELCDMTFTRMGSLNRHVKTVHKKQKNFQSKDGLHKHMALHTEKNSFLCELCDMTFTRMDSLNRHVKTVHKKQKNYQCDLCNKMFSDSSYLNQHKRIHNKEKPYSCSTCDKKFTFSSDLTVHIRLHTGDKPYSCNTCAKKFSSSSDLRKHMRIHAGDKLYSCNTCNKKFTFSSSLKAHIRIHTGEKPHMCGICNTKFSYNFQLKEHMTLHTVTSFLCNICNMKFTRLFTLQEHMRLHTGAKAILLHSMQ